MTRRMIVMVLIGILVVVFCACGKDEQEAVGENANIIAEEREHYKPGARHFS